MRADEKMWMFLVTLALAIGLAVGLLYMNHIWIEASIESRHGEYNSETGKFQWKQ